MPHSLASPAGSAILKTPVSLFFHWMYEVYRCPGSFSSCCKKSHSRRPFVLGDSPFSSLLEVGTAEGEGGALEVGVGGATGEAAIESSESLWEDPLLCSPLVAGVGFWGVVIWRWGGRYIGPFAASRLGEPPEAESSDGAGERVTELVWLIRWDKLGKVSEAEELRMGQCPWNGEGEVGVIRPGGRGVRGEVGNCEEDSLRSI